MPVPGIAYFGRNNEQNNSKPIRAGESIRMRIELNRRVTAADNNGDPLKVFLEYQRVVIDPGGFPTTAAISDGYFRQNSPQDFPPKQIEIPVNSSRGVSGAIVVRQQPTQNNTPIAFPDDLLITAYIDDLFTGPRRSHLVTVIAGNVRADDNVRVAADLLMLEFSGTSTDGVMQEALDAAVGAAQNAAGTDRIINWSLLRATGRRGGFAGFNDLTVAIEAQIE
jgi:hypothetical protein